MKKNCLHLRSLVSKQYVFKFVSSSLLCGHCIDYARKKILFGCVTIKLVKVLSQLFVQYFVSEWRDERIVPSESEPADYFFASFFHKLSHCFLVKFSSIIVNQDSDGHCEDSSYL